MATKRLRQRIARVMPSFNSCRSTSQNNDSNSSFCLSPVNPRAFDDDFPPAPPRSSPVARRRSAAPTASLSCGCRPVVRRSRSSASAYAYDADADDLPRPRETPRYLWLQNNKSYHVVAKIIGEVDEDESPRLKIDSDDGDVIFFRPELRRPRRRSVWRRSRGIGRASTTSSADSGWFSSEQCENDNEETATLLSTSATETSTSAVAAAVKVATESVAVVKRSEDPKADFRKSMAEMVVEKGLYEAGELQQLLRCFLKLNDRRHHAAIFEAFKEICDALFPVAFSKSSSYYY